jgi:Kef-type K+ transport system membrane component KefB
MEFLSFFIILVAGLFFSGMFSRLHVPWVVALLLTGFLLGPHGLSVIPVEDPTLLFLSEIGLIFLMFMAGLETKWSRIKGEVRTISIMAGSIVVVSGGGGVLIGHILGYTLPTMFLLGIIFIASSIAVILPTLTTRGLIDTPLGHTILGTAMAADVTSLIFLSILLQTIAPSTSLPLPLFYLLLLAILIIMKWGIPRIHTVLRHISDTHAFEREIRLILILMIGTVVIFELLGLHAVIAGFFVGFVLSESVKTTILKEKLHALAYGIFIPMFFVLVGVRADIGHLWNSGGLPILLGIVGGGIVLKILGAYLGGSIAHLPRRESFLTGVSLIPQLSTMFAAVFAGSALGLIDDTLLAALVAASALSVVLAPIGFALIHKNDGKEEPTTP